MALLEKVIDLNLQELRRARSVRERIALSKYFFEEYTSLDTRGQSATQRFSKILVEQYRKIPLHFWINTLQYCTDSFSDFLRSSKPKYPWFLYSTIMAYVIIVLDFQFLS